MMSFIFGLILVLIGVSALLGFSLFKFAFALLLIVFGIKLMTKDNVEKDDTKEHKFSECDSLNEVAIFSPLNKKIKSDKFKNGKVVMVFSGGQIDLRDVVTEEKEINLEIVVVFGSVKLLLPKNWKINSQGTAVFGGYDNKTEQNEKEVILNLKGSVTFGEIIIMN